MHGRLGLQLQCRSHQRRRFCAYAEANLDCDGNCLNDADGDGVCDELEVVGCQDESACNYDMDATDAGDCDYAAEHYGATAPASTTWTEIYVTSLKCWDVWTRMRATTTNWPQTTTALVPRWTVKACVVAQRPSTDVVFAGDGPHVPVAWTKPPATLTLQTSLGQRSVLVRHHVPSGHEQVYNAGAMNSGATEGSFGGVHHRTIHRMVWQLLPTV